MVRSWIYLENGTNRFSHELGVGGERKRKVKDDFKTFGLSYQRGGTVLSWRKLVWNRSRAGRPEVGFWTCEVWGVYCTPKWRCRAGSRYEAGVLMKYLEI